MHYTVWSSTSSRSRAVAIESSPPSNGRHAEDSHILVKRRMLFDEAVPQPQGADSRRRVSVVYRQLERSIYRICYSAQSSRTAIRTRLQKTLPRHTTNHSFSNPTC